MISVTQANPQDILAPPTSEQVAQLLQQFWHELAELPELLARGEQLLCADCTAKLRRNVLEMMLALNGIAYPTSTRRLNDYLSASQRGAIEKTLLAPAIEAASWLGQAVAFIVIYRWYAPQLAAAFALTYDKELENETLARLQHALPDWPISITTD